MKILVHSCCGPCSSWVLNSLKESYPEAIIYLSYYNPNIFPDSEYIERLMTQKQLLDQLDFPVEIVDVIHREEDYTNLIESLRNEIPIDYAGEKSLRCYNCYKLRLQQAFKTAGELGCNAVTTTLSVSPHKVSSWINEIGEALASEKVKWIHSDFKKQNGYQKSILLSKEFNLRRQDYCGCIYSLEEKQRRIKNE